MRRSGNGGHVPRNISSKEWVVVVVVEIAVEGRAIIQVIDSFALYALHKTP